MCAVHLVIFWHICSAFCCDVMTCMLCILCCCGIYAIHLVVMLWCIYSAFYVLLWHTCMCSASCDVMAHIYSLHLVVMLWHIYMLSIFLWCYDGYVVHFVVMLCLIYMLCIFLWCYGTYTGCPRRNVPDFGRGVPYVKVCWYNPRHLCPKLNGYGDNGQRKVWSSGGSTLSTCQLTVLSMSVLECGVIWWQFSSH